MADSRVDNTQNRLNMIRLKCMNETNITPRHSSILNLISSADGLLRGQIQDELKKIYPLSKPTLIRDLKCLLNQKLIVVKGKGKNTKYYPYEQNPLLRVFDLDKYFLNDPDQRLGVEKSFNFRIFTNLHHLFTQNEMTTLEKIALSFTKETAKLSPDIIKRELERFVIELSWKSSKIEGNTYTLLETEALIKEQKEAVGKTKDEATMILNHKSAFETILKNSSDFKAVSITLINQLHNILVKDLSITTGIRKQAVGITGTLYHPPDNEFQIKEAFEKTVRIINSTQNAFEKALIAHCMIPYLQPYADGNKRTGRMLTNAILLAHDLYPISYRSVDEEEFKKALILFYEQGSLFHIKRLLIEQIKFANQNYFR